MPVPTTRNIITKIFPTWKFFENTISPSSRTETVHSSGNKYEPSTTPTSQSGSMVKKSSIRVALAELKFLIKAKFIGNEFFFLKYYSFLKTEKKTIPNLRNYH
jgi:hypothetical protein